MVMTPQGDIMPVPGYAADVGYPDLTAVALAETRRTGWEPDTDLVICELLGADDRPLPLCPAGALVRAVEGWRALGYEPYLGFELELYLLDPRRRRPLGPGRRRRPHRVRGRVSVATRPAWR